MSGSEPRTGGDAPTSRFPQFSEASRQERPGGTRLSATGREDPCCRGVMQDPLDYRRVFDAGDDLDRATETRADVDVHLEKARWPAASASPGSSRIRTCRSPRPASPPPADRLAPCRLPGPAMRGLSLARTALWHSPTAATLFGRKRPKEARHRSEPHPMLLARSGQYLVDHLPLEMTHQLAS